LSCHNAANDETRSWIFTVAPFLERVDDVRICPDDKNGPGRRAERLTSYVMNAYLTDEPLDLFITNINRLTAASKTLVGFEIADLKLPSIENDHAHNHGWFTRTNLARRRVFQAIETDAAVHRHGGASHLLYADWHVAIVSAETVAEWAETQTPTDNFCIPK